ncbi:MAG: nicotinamide-nucleotide amidase [Betaproteobacteria bacterium]|nr:MAG: nicotinamide-nucleotide amidase [Betaproteobacteria bacterium]
MDKEIYDLSERLGMALKAAGMLLATAESCTGGWISQAVTMVPGSSNWFDCGFVTYTNRSKHEVLGVRSSTLEDDGAVSELTVREMAEGALQRSEANCSVAVSGIAGPDGGSASKPVGTVWLAVADNQGDTQAWRLNFQGDRDQVRRQTVMAALRALLDRVRRPQSV